MLSQFVSQTWLDQDWDKLRKLSSLFAWLMATRAWECFTHMGYNVQMTVVRAIGTGVLPFCLSGVIIGTADFHLWGLGHFSKRSLKTGKSRHIEAKAKESKVSTVSVSFCLHCSEQFAPLKKQACWKRCSLSMWEVDCQMLPYSWPSPGAGSSDQPNEKHMKAGEPTSVPPQLGELLNSQFYEVEQLSIAYPDERTFLLRTWINKQVITSAWF